MTEPFTVLFPDEFVEAVARRSAEIVLDELRRRDQSSPWLAGAQAAADYLGVSRGRIYKNLADIPHHRHRGRLMFRRVELDRWLDDDCRER